MKTFSKNLKHMKEKDINGKTIYNAIGYCHCRWHKGALNRYLIRQKKCLIKNCKHIEIYASSAPKKQKKQKEEGGKNRRMDKD